MAEPKSQLNVRVSPDLLARIEARRFERQHKTLNEAVVALLERGLLADPPNAPEIKRQRNIVLGQAGQSVGGSAVGAVPWAGDLPRRGALPKKGR